MAETLSAISVLSRLGSAFNRCNFPSFCLKPLQVKCFECLLKGQDIIAVLPTGFGKSLLFQLLPDFLPVKADKNIVIVVCPLNSIIGDQLNFSRPHPFFKGKALGTRLDLPLYVIYCLTNHERFFSLFFLFIHFLFHRGTWNTGTLES